MRLCGCLVGLTAMVSGADAFAQTIQLPSVHVFSVDTTVIVPDSGQAWVAGDKRASSGTNRFGGIGPQRATGIERQATGAAVVAKIHDPQQADQALLEQAKAGRAKLASGQAAPKAELALTPSDPGLRSVADIQRQRAQQAAGQKRETLALVEKARQAGSEGKASTAALYYRTASRQATGSLKQQIDAEMRRLQPAPSTAKSGRSARAEH